MRVLAMASQKGGSGKTTLSGHLAVQAQLAGHGPVVLIDIDPQGSLADWWNEREAEMPAFAQTTVARLQTDLEVLRQQGFKLAVIDTPPAITMAIQSVIQVAELIVAGQTYREVGGRLFISAKTVEHHVSRILGKLGVSNRREAARAAEHLDLPTA